MLVEKNNFEGDNIDVVNNQKFRISQQRYYDNGWNEGCHRILVTRWYSQYRFFVRAGGSISYYTRIYKREWLFGPKRLVWQKKDNGNLSINGTCDSIRIITSYNTNITNYIDTIIDHTNYVFLASKNGNSLSKSRSVFSLTLFGPEEISSVNIFDYNISFTSPFKTGDF